MGLFLQKLEKSLRLSTRAHVVDLPLDSGAVPPMRDQETHVAGGCGLSLSPEQQLLVDVLKQLYKIREEREKAEQHQRRSRAAASSYGRNVVEFLDEFVKVVAVCQAVLSQRAGEAPAAAAVNRKRKLDSAEWWDQERKEQREDDNSGEEEEGAQIRDMLAHLRKRAKVVVGGGMCCEHHEKGGLQARRERSLCCCGGPAEVVGAEQSQEALRVVTLVQQVVTTMTAAANHGHNKRGWLSAALDNGWAGGVHEKRRRTVATTGECSPPAGCKRKWAEDGGAAPSVRARDTLRRTANTKGHTNYANNSNNYNSNTINIAAATNCNNANRQEKRKKLGITIFVTPASCD